MAYTTIDDPSAHFQTKIWTGNATTRTIDLDSNSTMQPDFSWVKTRSATHTHYLVDSSTGTDKYLRSQMSAAQQSATVVTFNSTGIGLASGVEPNTNTETVVGWFWKANGGTRSTFTESGDNPGGGYQVNTTAGFSIVDYTGTGAAGTVSHGLTAKPEFIIVKRLDGTADWNVYHHKNTAAPETDYLRLNTTNSTSDVTHWNDTAPTTSVFSVGTDSSVNGDANTYIAFCWASKQGYSKFGMYEGIAAANGPFIYTGFKPAWVMVKNIDNAGYNWALIDHKRTPFNGEGVAKWFWPDLADKEFTDTQSGIDMDMDLLSNGFKITTARSELNLASTFFYMAFAEQPFVTSDGVPVTGR